MIPEIKIAQVYLDMGIDKAYVQVWLHWQKVIRAGHVTDEAPQEIKDFSDIIEQRAKIALEEMGE